MFLLELEEVHSIVDSIFSNYFKNEWYNSLFELFRYTRDKKNRTDPEIILGIQKTLVENLQKGEAVIKEGKKYEDKENYKRQLPINLHIRTIMKSIFDGVVWRTLKYDRERIRLISENKSSGYLNEDVDGVLMYCAKIFLERREIAFVNDLSNFLRIGDITHIDKNDRIIILELKEKGRKFIRPGSYLTALRKQKRGDKVSSQLQKILELQYALDFNKILYGEETVSIVNSDLFLKHELNSVEKCLEECKRNGVSSRNFGEYGHLTAYDLRKIPTIGLENFKNIISRHIHPFKESDKILSLSNYDAFKEDGGEFMRNFTPYSIFPWKEEYCLDIMCGYIVLIYTLSLSQIKKELEEEGWSVEIKDFSKPRTPYTREKNRLFAKPYDSSVMKISKGKSFLNIPMVYLSKLMQEFLSLATLKEFFNEIYSETIIRQSSRYVSYRFTKEKIIWR